MRKIVTLKGGFDASKKRFAIVVSDFNEYFTKQLLGASLDTLMRHGASAKNIRVIHVPGAFEIPLMVKKILRTKKYDSVITLAVIIRGQTRHFDQVVIESAKGVREAMLDFNTPVILGILPCENIEQARERVGIKQMNKGREWALSAIEMANLNAMDFRK